MKKKDNRMTIKGDSEFLDKLKNFWDLKSRDKTFNKMLADFEQRSVICPECGEIATIEAPESAMVVCWNCRESFTIERKSNGTYL